MKYLNPLLYFIKVGFCVKTLRLFELVYLFSIRMCCLVSVFCSNIM